MSLRLAAALSTPWVAALLTGCATPEPPPAVVSAAMPEPEPAPSIEPPRRDPLKHLAGRDLKPMPVRPLNARAHCRFKDETGYRGQLRLDVRDAAVTRFDARVDMPRRGSCQFRLGDFEQTGRLPAVVLQARGSGCQIRLWEQQERITVAFHECRKECSGDSVDYLWPILVDNRKGSCS